MYQSQILVVYYEQDNPGATRGDEMYPLDKNSSTVMLCSGHSPRAGKAMVLLVAGPGLGDSAGTVFRKVSEAGFGTSAVGAAWSAPDVLRCAARCLTRYHADCKSIVYHKPSQQCMPGGAIFTTLSSPPPGDLYATNTDCRNSNGLLITLFELLIYGSSGTCQNL